MADAFRLQGSYELVPLSAPASFAQSVVAPITEAKTLADKASTDIVLSADAPVPIPFGSLPSANVVILKSTGGKVTARLTSADGSAQSIPFDTYFILMSDSVPITAIDLTRVAGIPTTVRIFIGQKA
jgi:hypothetical protein